MLRPAVAVTNCASAGVTSGLVIGRQRLSLKKAADTVNLRVTGPTKCPSGARSSTRWEDSVIAGRERGVVRPAHQAPSGLCCSAEQGEVRRFLGRDELESPRKRRFCPYTKRPSRTLR